MVVPWKGQNGPWEDEGKKSSFVFSKGELGRSMVVQWLGLQASNARPQFNPWSKNSDPEILTVWPIDK